ncbi:mitochondrial antiviral-signaling protein isoform X2 [Carcharodon carcharias]|nr:mitochondrial antiviral-signaling protein isoform X2 [Carcharodon carcharias]
MVPVVPPPSAPVLVSLPQHLSSSVTVDNSESSPGVFPPAGYLPTHPSSNQPALQSSASTPVAQTSTGTPVVQSSANAPVMHSSVGTPVVQNSAGTAVVQSSANAPVVQPLAGTPIVQSSANTFIMQSSVGTPVVQNSTGTAIVQSSANAPVVQPLAGTPAVQPSANTYVMQSSVGTPVVQNSTGTAVVQSSANAPVVQPLAGTPAVQPSANTYVMQSSVGTPVVQNSTGTAVVQSSANAPVVQPLAGTPVVQSSANTSIMQSSVGTPVVQNSTGPPVVQSSVGAPVVSSSAPAANLQPVVSLASNTSTASSSVSSTASNSVPQCPSIEFKMPIQEMGKSVDREGSKDDKLPVQEMMVPFDHSKPNGAIQPPKNQTINSDQNNSGEKRQVKEIFVPNTDQAKREMKNRQDKAEIPSTCRQVHPLRPLYQSNDDSQDIDKPEILRSDIQNTQSATEVASNLSEGGCSITSSDLQLSESTVDNSRTNDADSSLPLFSPNQRELPEQAHPLSLGDGGAHVSCDFSDKNSIKEQKIQALQGYQNDSHQRSFYDVHQPLNIQLNFDAQNKIHGIGEGIDSHQKDILNQNINVEYKPTAFQMSNIKIAQSVPAPTGTHPVDNRADSEVQFMKNVQVNNTIGSISRSDQLLISSDTGSSFGDSSVNDDSANEPSVYVEQGSQNANLLNNNPPLQSFQLLGMQESGQIGDMDASQENALKQTTEHGCELDPIGDWNVHFDCNESYANRFTGTELDKNSSLEVNVVRRGGPLNPCEVSHSKCDTNPDVGDACICNEDTKEPIGHIYQEPDKNNETGNDHEFETANLGDVYRRDVGKSSIDALSTEHVSLASKKRSQARQPVNSNWDLPQSNYLFLSMSVLVLSVVAACIWKCYRN